MPQTPPIASTDQIQIPGVTILNSRDIINQHTKLALHIWAPSGFGKTQFAGKLDALTQKYDKKRTLYIAIEAGEGGGAATLHDVDVPIFTPNDYSHLFKTLTYLKNDKTVGGVVLDSASELAKRYIKSEALKYPTRDKSDTSATRLAGVPNRGDYQVMGELASQLFLMLLSLTTHEKPEYRKHLIVCSTDNQREEDGKVEWIGPDLPGRMGRESVQMFQQVGTIKIKPQVINGKRENQRVLTFVENGVLAVKDRYKMYPEDILLRKNPEGPGEDLLSMYEKYWLSRVQQR